MDTQVDIRLQPDGRHHLLLNGQDISHCVQGVTFDGHPGPDSVLWLHIHVPTITVGGQVQVLLGEDTRSLLTGLGWTPPE